MGFGIIGRHGQSHRDHAEGQGKNARPNPPTSNPHAAGFDHAKPSFRRKPHRWSIGRIAGSRQPRRPARDPRLPVTLITGFLGAGKSTLLNALIRHPDFADAAILVNEFGDVGIDSALVRSVDGTVTTLATGCVCCAMRGELITALKDLNFKRVRGEVPEFTRLAIETSGLADPAPIFATLLNEPVLASVYRIDGIVAVIDGEHGAVQLDDRAEAVAQAAIADRLLISKTDRADPAEIARLRARLEQINPTAEIVAMNHGDIAPDLLIGCFNPSRPPFHDHGHKHGHDHRDGISATPVRLATDWPRTALESRIRLFLTLNDGAVLQLKGIARCADGALYALHGVRHIACPAQPIDTCSPEMENRLVLISDTPPEHMELLSGPAETQA